MRELACRPGYVGGMSKGSCVFCGRAVGSQGEHVLATWFLRRYAELLNGGGRRRSCACVYPARGRRRLLGRVAGRVVGPLARAAMPHSTS